MVSGARADAADLLEVIEEVNEKWRADLFQPEPLEGKLPDLLAVAQQQDERVPIPADRVWARVSLDRKVVGQKRP
jgi:hypothetical protein